MTIFSFFKKPWGISILVGAGVLALGYFYFSGPQEVSYQTVVAHRGDIREEVSVTGKVKPAESVEMAFEKGGKINAVFVRVGDAVTRGDKLVGLDNAELYAGLLGAEANLDAERARLAELERGTRAEDIAVAQEKVTSAETDFLGGKASLSDKINDSYTKSDDAIRNNADQAFLNPRSQSPQIKFSISDYQLEVDTEWQRLVMENLLVAWKSSLDLFSSSKDTHPYLDTAKNNLTAIKNFLEKMALAINNGTPNSNATQANIDAWKTSVSSARSSINIATSSLLAAEDAFNVAESNLALAKRELELKEARTIPEQITAEEAKVKSAEANVENYRAQVAKTIMRAPLSGVVTKQDAKMGEIAPAGQILVSLASTIGEFSAQGGPASGWQIEANIPEADIAKIKIGNEAALTLDAYGSDVLFRARVLAIDPAETVLEGVATYTTTLEFAEHDDRVKSGMTANIDIATAKRENAVVIPQRAVVSRENKKFVRILDASDNPEEVEVVAGLRGSDGNVEIIEGVHEGDIVITFQE